ncbi:MBL fold metallo-hydrolase [Clostridium estertheticum]|uniref:MBL fold metallo-hydrolase n=1 Tax=Clostridium estertheticum TaxID=238834 RepID=UPI001CF21C2E|nr:MBL fold metallo-hydrolase [Clostridium estertheticum]MCB2361339.1 MBL fold metallo-hydrolase [Clostridium estertheticum]
MIKQYFNVKEIMGGVYHINEPIISSSTVCCTLIVGKEKALLIDTGYGIGNLKQIVESITNLPIIVVNSHGHIDHVNGNYQFDKIYIHKEDISVKNKYATADVQNYLIEYFKQQNLEFPEGFSKEEYVNRNDNSVLIPVEEGHVFDLGEREIEVMYLPGHTNGSIALLDRKNKALFSGDTISSHVLMYLAESTSIHTYIKSLEKVNKLDFNNIIASHFTNPYNKDIINKLIHCASHIDISKSTIYANPANPMEGLMYTEGGEPFVSPNFVSIVYTKDKLSVY